jgi:hypothetical protein
MAAPLHRLVLFSNIISCLQARRIIVGDMVWHEKSENCLHNGKYHTMRITWQMLHVVHLQTIKKLPIGKGSNKMMSFVFWLKHLVPCVSGFMNNEYKLTAGKRMDQQDMDISYHTERIGRFWSAIYVTMVDYGTWNRTQRRKKCYRSTPGDVNVTYKHLSRYMSHTSIHTDIIYWR